MKSFDCLAKASNDAAFESSAPLSKLVDNSYSYYNNKDNTVNSNSKCNYNNKSNNNTVAE